MKWFGKSWGAPVCSMDIHAATPVNEPCLRCEELIEDGDQGVIMPYTDEIGTRDVPEHLNCFLRSIYGSVGHIIHECSCFKKTGNTFHDPPGMTRRQAADAAVHMYELMSRYKRAALVWLKKCGLS